MGRKLFIVAAVLLLAACGRIVVSPGKSALSENERLKLAAIYASKGEDALALREYADILNENKKSAPAYFGIGNIELKKKDYKEAVTNFIKAVEIDPSNGVFHNNLGWAYMEDGDIGKAEEEIRAAFTADPEKGYIYYDTLGVIKTRSRDFTKAEGAFLESIRNAPASDEAGLKEVYGHLLELYRASGQVEKAGAMK
ncbi:MAG: tetratricopeptide repeat protein [Deltaproteobacteria bacterium]|nr:tetratricopeptide repeat protein [Deltaproteobacteria bacterium]